MKIIHVNAKYPGSTHDSYIWNNCNLLPILKQLHNRRHTFYLLGEYKYIIIYLNIFDLKTHSNYFNSY